MSTTDEAHLVEHMATVIKRGGRDALLELAATCLSLKRRIDLLEQRPEVRYLGLWQADQAYAAGSLVTLRGSLWHAENATTSRPGSDSCWRLAVKEGTLNAR